MKIKLVQLYGFRRFKNLTIENIPDTARLVVMIGPNGSGKSSVFDALHVYKRSRGHPDIGDDPYYVKFDSSGQPEVIIKAEFHTGYPQSREDWDRSIHIRTAYRNDLVDNLGGYVTQDDPLISIHRFSQLADNDQAVASNYGRILNQWIERTSAIGRRDENVGDLQDEIFGSLRDAIAELFRDPELILTSLGSPTGNNVFQFNKGTSHGFSYLNLSSGEKAALDLILDIIVAKSEFNDTVFCIDEPEAHIHTKLQGPLLRQLYKLIPDNSQLWIATHSIGMVRKAQDLWREDPNSVVFLDFGDEELNFDDEATIAPASPNPNFWSRIYEIALGDLAELVEPNRIVLCESTEFDADCYNKIFGIHYPDTRFVSIGSCEDVERADTHLLPVIEAVTGGAEILRLRDRDEADMAEIKENKGKGIRTLLRRNIEGYLLDDEVLTQFCKDHKIPHKVQDLLDAKQAALKDSIARGKPPDDLKDTAQGIHNAAKNALRPRKIGNKSRNFMKNMIAPSIKPDMDAYDQLHDAIFGE